MIVWALVIVFATGVVPIDIFPDNGAGHDSCEASIAEARAAIPQAGSNVTCRRYTLTPVVEAE